jgi:2-hydroxychromene-2-carboxylate isomerase
VISPWAYLMDRALRGAPLPIALEWRPVLFAGLLNTFGNKGPAEIESKRRFTYELCTWTAQQQGVPFLMPSVHPFNPLRYLRLVLALETRPEAVSAVFEQLYTTGCDPDSETAWQAMLARVDLTGAEAALRMGTAEIKARLRDNTTRATEAGVFGVPTMTNTPRPTSAAWTRACRAPIAT